jgi:hypothetical protein
MRCYTASQLMDVAPFLVFLDYDVQLARDFSWEIGGKYPVVNVKRVSCVNSREARSNTGSAQVVAGL